MKRTSPGPISFSFLGVRPPNRGSGVVQFAHSFVQECTSPPDAGCPWHSGMSSWVRCRLCRRSTLYLVHYKVPLGSYEVHQSTLSVSLADSVKVPRYRRPPASTLCCRQGTLNKSPCRCQVRSQSCPCSFFQGSDIAPKWLPQSLHHFQGPGRFQAQQNQCRRWQQTLTPPGSSIHSKLTTQPCIRNESTICA